MTSADACPPLGEWVVREALPGADHGTIVIGTSVDHCTLIASMPPVAFRS